MLAGGHWQETTDVNDDAWADLAGYGRAVVRPRLFWDGGRGRTLLATAGFTYEDRTGGTPEEQVLAATGEPYVEALETHRYDAGAVGQFLLKGRYVMTARVAVARQSHNHQFGDILEPIGTIPPSARWPFVAPPKPDGLPGSRSNATRTLPATCPVAYTFTIPGAFAQYDFHVTPAFSLCRVPD